MDLWNWEFAAKIAPALAKASILTVELTVFGFAIALSLGLSIALLKRSQVRPIARFTSTVTEAIRLTPLLLQIFFSYYALPFIGVRMSAFATGFVVLGLHYACYCAEVYRAGLESVDVRQLDAAKVLGLPRYYTLRKVVLPEAIPPIIVPLGNYFVALFKETPLLSAIGLVEILYKSELISSASFRPVEPFTLAGVYFLILSVIAALIVNGVERVFSLRQFGV